MEVPEVRCPLTSCFNLSTSSSSILIFTLSRLRSCSTCSTDNAGASLSRRSFSHSSSLAAISSFSLPLTRRKPEVSPQSSEKDSTERFFLLCLVAAADGELGLLILRDWRFWEATTAYGDLLGLGRRIEGSASSWPMWNLSTAVFTEEAVWERRRGDPDVDADPSKSLDDEDLCLWGDWSEVWETWKANRTRCSLSAADGSASDSIEGDRGNRDPGIDIEGLRFRDRESWGLGECRERSDGKSSTLWQSTKWRI